MTNAERQKRYRDSKRNVTPSVTPVPTVTRVTPDPAVTCGPEHTTLGQVTQATVTPGGVSTIRKASLEDYKANLTDYIPRSEPDKLNWGPWLNSDELSRAGLKANRVAVEGDWDYAGVGAE